MKRIIVYNILLSVFATVFSTCSKVDVPPPPDLRFPLPLLTKDTTANVFIPGEDLASFLGKFIVDLYYGGAVKPKKMDLVVIRNDNKTNVKTIKADVTSFPATLEVTGTQLTTLFDSTIKPGDKFEIGADITTLNGQEFEAFPVTGTPYGADTTALPGYRFSIVYAVQAPPDLRFPLPLLTKDTNGDMFIPKDDPASFLGKFTIDMYYGTAVTPQKVDIVVIRNDSKTNVKTIKANVTTFPASIQVTGTDLTTLFDSTIKQGDKFEIGADVTTMNGQKFEAFPVAGNPYGADTAALPGSRFSIVYVSTCRFDKNSFNGQYTVVRNTIGDADWGDLKVGDLVSVRPGTGENDLVVVAYPFNTLVYPPYPMICQVNPVTFDVIVPRQLIGVPMYSYPYLWVEPGTGPGTVNPCGDAITINMTLSAVYDIGTPYSTAGILELRK